MIFKVDSLSVGYGGINAIESLSLEVNEGEFVSLVGPNGSGKTTLIKALSRILSPRRGMIRVSGKDITMYSRRELSKLIAYVPQQGGDIPPFAVRDFIAMGQYPHIRPFRGLSVSQDQRIGELLESFGLEPFSSRFLHTLSGGERQRAYIAAAIAQGAEVLLLDEPTTFLDPKHQDEIMLLLKQMNVESGITIITTTHDLNSAAMYSNRIIGMKNGRLVFDGNEKSFVRGTTLESIFDRRFVLLHNAESGRKIVGPSALKQGPSSDWEVM